MREGTPHSNDLLRICSAALGVPEIGALFVERLEEAFAAHPGMDLDPRAFAAEVAEALAAEDDPASALLHLRIADLYLARACARGGPLALARFEEIFGGELRAVGARLGRGAEGDDLAQRARERLFSPPSPRIADYAGTGDLRHFLRVALVRMLVDHQRATRRHREHERLEPDAPLSVPAPDDDAEMAYLKRRYGAAFRAAFEQAARDDLAPETRNILRRTYVDGLSIDELGHLYGVHRATAARRVARARAELLSATRRRLLDGLGLQPSELDSIMRLIESNVHLTAERIFATR